MRISGMIMIVITSLLLLLITIMVTMNIEFGWVFYLTCFGQIMVVLMVYAVLTDTYTTDKTFDDFYEDRPIAKDRD
ncbi:hypothetical protein [uncultured Aquimarina sp.]|uniref:hypothetical protein n=1 Tax=uncultured Aquimarina sp. TaxID=575652 RepID=UPI00263942ED|nr:hypothetical protein [uncultured Aquimarina sp.]